MSDEELEELRRKRLQAMQRQMSDEQQNEQLKKETEMQKEAVLRALLTTEARQRLTNLRMVRPEFTEQLEMQLIQLAQAGKLPIPLSDEQLKRILLQLQGRKREPQIRRK